MKRRELVAFLCFLALLLGSIAGLTYLLTPDNGNYGLKWEMFLQEERDSLDVCFLGSSLVYSDVVPAILYEETGLTTYLMATPEQTLGFSYYYLSELYKTQRPALVCVEVTGVFYPRYTNYTKVNVGFMPWSWNRIQATLHASEPEERLGLLFPLYNYHDLWSNPLRKTYRPTADPYAGYVFLAEAREIDARKPRAVEVPADVYEENMDYLRSIAALCAEQGSEVLFFIAPSAWPWEDGALAWLAGEMAAIENAVYLDFNEGYEDLGLDIRRDYFDLLHLNADGAAKFTRLLAPVLQGFGLEPRGRGEALWAARTAAYGALMAGR